MPPKAFVQQSLKNYFDTRKPVAYYDPTRYAISTKVSCAHIYTDLVEGLYEKIVGEFREHLQSGAVPPCMECTIEGLRHIPHTVIVYVQMDLGNEDRVLKLNADEYVQWESRFIRMCKPTASFLDFLNANERVIRKAGLELVALSHK